MIGKWSATALVAAACNLAFTVPALAHGSEYDHIMGGWHPITGPLMMGAGIALIVVLAVLLVRWLSGVRGSARGEIDRAD